MPNNNKSRILRFNDRIVITNFKCLFTTLNNVYPDDIYTFHYPTQHLFKIFLYRHTPNRLISTFLNWGVELPNRYEKWLMKIFKDLKGFDLTEYETYLKNDDIVSAFKMFLHALPHIKMKNGHIEPQYYVLTHSNYTNINVLLNTNNPNDISILERAIRRKLPVCNATNKDSQKRLIKFLRSNTKYLDLINAVYQDDAQFFSRFKIKINTIFAPPLNTNRTPTNKIPTNKISANNTTSNTIPDERKQNQIQKPSDQLHSNDKQDKDDTSANETAQTEA